MGGRFFTAYVVDATMKGCLGDNSGDDRRLVRSRGSTGGSRR